MATEWVDSWATTFDSASKISLDPELTEVRRAIILVAFVP